MMKKINQKKFVIGSICLALISIVFLSYQGFTDYFPTVIGSDTDSEYFKQINSESALLYDIDNNQLIESKQPDKRMYPASLTKMMTAYVALTELDSLDETAMISSDSFSRLQQEGASMAGFFAGEEVPVRELLYGILLPSGAEASIAVAEHLAGSETAFVKKMNQEAKKIGMNSTQFKNVTGLHHRGHYSTASDLARFLKVALANPQFLEMFTSQERIYTSSVHPEGLVLASSMFRDLDEGKLEPQVKLLGGKTGYTPQAEQCLASLALVNGKSYFLITLEAKGNPEKFDTSHLEDAITVYNRLANSSKS